MPPPEPPNTVTLRVKVPPGHLSGDDASIRNDEFPLGEIYTSSTIAQVRQRIQAIIPTNPAPERQRLLYGGRALVDNEQSVAAALNTKRDPAQTEYVLHLLVRAEGGSSTGAQSQSEGHRRAVSSPTTPAPSQQHPGAPHTPIPGVPHPTVPGAPGTGIPLNSQLRDQMIQQRLTAHLGQGAAPPGVRIVNPPPGMQVPQGMQQGVPFGAMGPGAGWNQALAQGQQQRAAMRMNGLGRQEGSGTEHQDGTEVAQGQAEAQTQQLRDSLQDSGQHQQQPQGVQGANPRVGQRGFHVQGVGPTGHGFQVHQQVFNIPHMPGTNLLHMQMPLGPPQPSRSNGPSALDRARDNMAEMQRMLAEMREQGSANEEQQRRINEIQERARSVNAYIDPLHLHNAGSNPSGRRSAPPPGTARREGVPHVSGLPQLPRQPQHLNEVTAHLLSGPDGPKAILLSPQHGRYTGTVSNNAFTPAPTRTIPASQPPPSDQLPQTLHAPNPNLDRQIQPNPQQHPAPQAAGAGAQAPVHHPAGAAAINPLNAALGHLWLLLRLAIFAYFVLGMEMGWQRPLLMTLAGLVFWLMRAGVFGGVAGAVRGWWEEVMEVPGAEEREPRQQGRGSGSGQDSGAERTQTQGQGPAQGQAQPPAPPANQFRAAPPRPMPTPAQVAQRLLDEEQQRQRERRRQRRANLPWWREQIRPAERALALFVASLWPGVGEAQVEAREREARRVREEAEAEDRRRREADEEAEKRKREGEGQSAEKEGSGMGQIGAVEKDDAVGVTGQNGSASGAGVDEKRGNAED